MIDRWKCAHVKAESVASFHPKLACKRQCISCRIWFGPDKDRAELVTSQQSACRGQ